MISKSELKALNPCEDGWGFVKECGSVEEAYKRCENSSWLMWFFFKTLPFEKYIEIKVKILKSFGRVKGQAKLIRRLRKELHVDCYLGYNTAEQTIFVRDCMYYNQNFPNGYSCDKLRSFYAEVVGS